MLEKKTAESVESVAEQIALMNHGSHHLHDHAKLNKDSRQKCIRNGFSMDIDSIYQAPLPPDIAVRYGLQEV
jgi:hypothetical protein